MFIFMPTLITLLQKFNFTIFFQRTICCFANVLYLAQDLDLALFSYISPNRKSYLVNRKSYLVNP